MTGTVLWRTEVGSFMWGMQHPGSDHDLFQCHVQPTRTLLRGESYRDADFTQDKTKTPPEDLQDWDLGKLIGLLLKGNVNAYWNVFSPIVHEARPITLPMHWWLADPPLHQTYLENIQGIVLANPSKAIYHSTKGLATNNLKDVQTNERWLDPRWRTKKLNIIYRTLSFAATLIMDNKVYFGKPEHTPALEDVASAIHILDDIYKDSPLPELPNPEPFREFLFQVRMAELEGRI